MGKSALAQTIAEALSRKRPRQLAASFFFARKSRERNHIEKFAWSIAYQLMFSVQGAESIILQRIEGDSTIVQKSFEWIWDTLVVDTLTLCQNASEPMVIIIDGVDECLSLREQSLLLETLLRSTQRLGPLFKLLITSRPEVQIQAIFNSKYDHSKANDHEVILGEKDRQDIEHFLHLSFSAISANRQALGVPLVDPWPPEDAASRLAKKACGQFIYASIVVAFVQGNGNDDPKARLELILQARSKSFREVDYLYLLIMKDIQKSLPRKERHWLHYLLVLLLMHVGVFSFSHFVPGVPRALEPEYRPKKFSEGLFEALLGKLHPVIDARRDFRHKTFFEFLTRPSAPHPFSITSHHLSGPLAQELLGQTLKYSALWRYHKPTPQLIFSLAALPCEAPIDDLDTDYSPYPKLFLGWMNVRIKKDVIFYDLKRRKRTILGWLNLLWQLPLFLLIGLPLYALITVKQTSPYLYKYRTHDLGPPHGDWATKEDLRRLQKMKVEKAQDYDAAERAHLMEDEPPGPKPETEVGGGDHQ
ncbi:hypothetical protein BDN72DRAFT_961822 [Pluteus cervinus]|uniref:Uncharacterized protein n=1 Tax=Pluteus cervinus TaxID=181527 RepID=A0ACD3AN33_9AGAR|nr:hypothetical protein BDN72DRAFT_961822 [Pluteus cervinus]